MNAAKSMFKKVRSITKNGLAPYEEGKQNYKLNIPTIEQVAAVRLKTCLKCSLFTKETVSFLKVEDERLKKSSEMICGDCGCSTPYLLRQYSKICKKW